MSTSPLSNGTNTSPKPPLHLLIIGAGICGLATAISCAQSSLRVTVFEAASPLHEVGAGMQITPNGTRILRSLGVYSDLEGLAAVPDALTIHRYSGEKLVHKERYKTEIMSRFGSPIWCLHRVDLHQTLARRARELGVEIRLGTRIEHVDFEKPAIVVRDGEVVTGDAVLAADGLWSSSRNALLGEYTPPAPTGDLAYRILLEAKDIEDMELRKWITKPALHIWLGPKSHVVGYSIRGGEMYNLVLLCPDDLGEGVRKEEADLEEMKSLFVGWDPILTRLLTHVSHVDKWKLHNMPALKTWSSPQGTFAMAGDAIHPILPYMAQGANSALEDSAVFSHLLCKTNQSTTPSSSSTSDPSSPSSPHLQNNIKHAIKLYEKTRKPRVDWVANETVRLRNEHHLIDGEQQRERDRIMSNGNWTHPRVRQELFSYDAMAEAERVFNEQGKA